MKTYIIELETLQLEGEIATKDEALATARAGLEAG